MEDMGGSLVAAVIASARPATRTDLVRTARSTRRQPPPLSNDALGGLAGEGRASCVRNRWIAGLDRAPPDERAALLGTDGRHQSRSGGSPPWFRPFPTGRRRVHDASGRPRSKGVVPRPHHRWARTARCRDGERVPVHVGDAHDHRSCPCPDPDGAARSCDRLGSAQWGQLAGGACRSPRRTARAGTVGRPGPR